VTALIDISTPLAPGMVAWPGSPNVEAERFLSLASGDPANATRLALDVHCGTHVDAPLHMLAGAPDMESLALDVLVGPAVVVELGDVRAIGPDELAAVVPDGATRVLLKTLNSRGGVAADAFDEDFAALSADGARWLVDRGVRLVGIDYLSIQRYADDPTTHHVLLGAGVVILEGLRLADVAPGAYELLCLPVLAPRLEAAPARAVLRTLEGS
jgi:arylformamidase